MNTNFLGWDCSVSTQIDYLGKKGILTDGNFGPWTFFGIFKGNTPVVLLVNSNTPGNITGLVVKDFNNARVPQPDP